MNERITNGNRSDFKAISRVRNFFFDSSHCIRNRRSIVQFNHEALRSCEATQNTIQFYRDSHGLTKFLVYK